MGPLGTPELILIFIVVLLLFGAKKLPELARGIGKSMGEFKKAREDFEREITRSEGEARVKEASGKEPRDS
jgi:sec-independent protein translocase protein TatA